MRIPWTAALAAILLLSASPATAYLDGGGGRVTLPEILSEFRTLTIVEVEKADLARGGIKFRTGRPLKGKAEFQELKLQMTWEVGGAPYKELPAGRIALHFTQSCDKQFRAGASSAGFDDLIAQRASLTFLDGVWLHSMPGVDGWQSGSVRRDFEQSFLGSTAELLDAASRLLRGHEVVVRCRRRKNSAESQWVRYSLKAPNNKAPARDPAAPAVGSRPLAAWTAELRDPSSAVRMQAALALAELGPAAREAEAALILTARDPDPELRYAAVVALGAIVPESKEGVEALARSLADEDWFVQLAAAQALQGLGERAKAAVPALVAALAPRDSVRDFRPVRCGAAMAALARIDPGAKELGGALRFIVERLLENERQGSFGARATGARLLGDCGAVALPVLPAVAKLLQDADGEVRVAAAEALLKISPATQAAAALDALAAALKHPELRVRLRAAEAPAGPQARPLRPALEAALTDPEPEVRQAAAQALNRIGP